MDEQIYASEAETSAASQGPTFNVHEYLRLLQRRWPIIAACALLGVGLGTARYSMTPRLYRTSTTLQIEQRSLMAVGSENPWLDAWVGVRYFPTQYRLLESRGLAERVVVDLNLQDDPDFGGVVKTDDPEGEERRIAGLAGKIQAGLEVEPVQGTELVHLRFEGADPKLAARILNGLSSAYVDWGIETRTADVGKASSFIGQEIRALRQEIDDKEDQLREYGRDIEMVSLDPESNEILERIGQLNRSYTQAIADRVDLEARNYELQSTPPATIAEARPTPLINEARRARVALERDYEGKLTVYKPDHPLMVDLEKKIRESQRFLEQLINDEVTALRRQAGAALETARRRERSLKSQFEAARDDALALNSVAVQVKNIDMEISTRRELMNQLLRRQSEAGMTARLQSTRESNVRIIDRALVPTSPFRPSLRNDLSAGLSSGLVLGIGIVFLLHFLDRSIKSAEELERLLGLPVLAVVPALGLRRRGYYGYSRGHKRRHKKPAKSAAEEPTQIELVPATNPRLGISEAYRSLRTALLLSTAGGLRVCAITSAEAGEGKTATAVNLGVVMAQLGRKTLLIDADLRKSRLHRILKVSNRIGLVNVLTEGLDLESTLKPTEVPNLTVLPAGPTPPNPSELLASEAMTNVIQMARHEFDFVIIDSPPVLAVTDAILAGKLSEGILLCFRAGSVHRADARSCCDQLQLAGLRVLGTVLNCYEPMRSGGYDRRYYYHYAYEPYGDDSQRCSGRLGRLMIDLHTHVLPGVDDGPGSVSRGGRDVPPRRRRGL